MKRIFLSALSVVFFISCEKEHICKCMITIYLGPEKMNLDGEIVSDSVQTIIVEDLSGNCSNPLCKDYTERDSGKRSK